MLAILGLVLAPVSATAMATPVVMHGAVVEKAMAENGMVLADEASTISSDMPCCPDEKPTRDCGNDCALMAMCANLALQVPTFATLLIFRPAVTPKISSRNDAPRDSLAQAPPPRPPRT